VSQRALESIVSDAGGARGSKEGSGELAGFLEKLGLALKDDEDEDDDEEE